MANIRVKDLDTKASFASDDEILMDSPSGTGTMLRDAFIAAVASQIVAAPSTYKIATLDGANKLTSSQDPSQSVSYLGGHDMVANSPALADGSGTAGDTYYVTNPGTRNYGSGNITAQEGDALVYSGSVWQLVEGIANILDGISTASTARTTLSVNSKDEDAEATGTKLVGPALYFDGSNDYVEVAADSKLSFTDGTDDLPFSVSAFIKADDLTTCPVVGKYGTSAPAREWRFAFDGSDKLELALFDTGGHVALALSTTALTSYEGQWFHVCATYAGSAASAFTTAADQITMYVNGQSVSVNATNDFGGTYDGMTDGTNPLWVGRYNNSYKKSHIRNVQIYNRELTATEVAELAKGNELGFADEWGDHTNQLVVDGDMEAVGTADWIVSGGATVSKETASPYSGTRNLKLLSAGAGGHYVETSASTIASGKRYRAKFRYRTGGTAAVYTFRTNGSTWQEVSTLAGAASWTLHEVEFVADSGRNGRLTFYIAGGDATSYIEVDSFEVVAIGTLADFRAENFIADKLIDQSSNNFVGTNNGATLVGGRKALQLDTDGAAAGNNVLSIYNGSSHLAYLTDKGDLNANSISSGASTELTIATGAVTATKSYHTIDTESDAASDDLDTISGGRAGQILVVQANNSARSVVLKDGTGNLKLSGDITLDNAEDTATLVSDGTSWYLIATSNNGA